MAIGFQIPFGVDVTNAIPADQKYGPYVSLAAAKAAIPLALRYDGLTVQITGLGNYWWLASDLSDNGLIPKQAALTSTGITGALGFIPISNSLPSTQILVGNSTGIASPVSVSGDITISNTGLVTISSNFVTLSGTQTISNKSGNISQWTNNIGYITGGYADNVGITTLAASKSYADNVGITTLAAAKTYADGLVVGLWDDRGNYDASGNVYPSSGGSGTGGAILKGDIWTISVVGVLGGVAVSLGDTIRAIIDSPGQTPSNWATTEANLGYTPLTNVLPSAQIFVGNATGIASPVTVSGDITLNNTGVATISSNFLTLSGPQNISNKTGNISQWTNDIGYITPTGVTTSLGYIPYSSTNPTNYLAAGGYTWVTRTSAASIFWTGICSANGIFVSVAVTGTGNRVMTSVDGINWIIRTSAADNNWKSVCYGNGLFVAVAYSGTGNRVMTSPDGITWTIRSSAADNQWFSVCYGNGLFVAVSQTGTGNRVMTSPDGITWTIRTSAADNNWQSVCYGNGLFVAVASSGTGNRVMTSPDGITWTLRTSAADNAWAYVCYGNGLFVAVSTTGTGNRVMYSPDGITWTIGTSAADNQWKSVCYGNGLFVAVAQSGTGNRVMTSLDGITWTIRNSSADNSWQTVCYANGLFVAVAVNGTGVMTSGFQLNNDYKDNLNNNFYVNNIVYTTGVTGNLYYKSASGNLVPLANGTTGQVVTYDGVSGPYWNTPAAVTGGTVLYSFSIPVALSTGKTFGKYVNGQTATYTNQTLNQILLDIAQEALAPTLTLTSSTTIAFNQTSINNVLNFSKVINSFGASTSTAVLEWRRNNTGSWTTLTSVITDTTFTHSLTDSAFNTQPFNYRYTVVDTSGGTATVTKDITPSAYVAPTITFSAPAASITSPETNTTREKGNISSNLQGSTSRNSVNVPISGYQYAYSLNGGAFVNIGSFTSLAATGGSFTTTNDNNNSLVTANTIAYRVTVTDSFTTTSSTYTITFKNIVFYGSAASNPLTSSAVRALGNRRFSDAGNNFILNTGTSNSIFTVAVLSTQSLVSVYDIDSANANYTSSFVLSTFNVDDAGSTPTSYNVYTLTQGVPFATSHQLNTTIA